jgi:hypothetical protein
MGARVELEDLAMDAMTYELDAGHKAEDVQEEDRFYLSDDYKRRVVEHMSVAQVRGACAWRSAPGPRRRPPRRHPARRARRIGAAPPAAAGRRRAGAPPARARVPTPAVRSRSRS